MKKAILMSLIASLIVLGCSQKQGNSPVGAWRLISTEVISGNETHIEFPITYSGFQYKIWTDKNWMFLSEWEVDTLSGETYGGGSYTIDGDQYVENIEFHSNPGYDGLEVSMTMEIRNDTLIQMYHPVDSLGQTIEGEYSVESYVRWE